MVVGFDSHHKLGFGGMVYTPGVGPGEGNSGSCGITSRTFDSSNPNKIYCRVVELVNTSDFDSEDYRFESCRDNNVIHAG